MTSTGPRLLRASDFCRNLSAPRVAQVNVKVLSCAPSSASPESTIYVSVDLLVALSLTVESVAWLYSSDSSKGIPVIVQVDEKAEPVSNGTHVVKVPPTVAASVGYTCCTSDLFRLKPCATDPKEAYSVTVQPIGHPVPPNWRDTELPVPSIPSRTRLVSPSTLISVWHAEQLFVFEVIDVRDESRQPVKVAITNGNTEWTLEARPLLESSVPRLPPLSLAESFYKSMVAADGNDQGEKTNRIQGQQDESDLLPPYPSLTEMKNALLLPASAPPAQRILHVVGTQENQVQTCIQSAADALGLRYMCVKGLAAHAHASNLSVSTGSLADRLAGCKAALRQAQSCVPCALHLSDIDLEWSQDDEPLRQMQQQRLWTVLMDALCRQEVEYMPSTCMAPSLIVVLSTTKALATGPLLHNLVFSPVTITVPDEAYARYLWKDEETFDNFYPTLLVGRSAQDICHLARYWRHCRSEAELENFCQDLDKRKRNATPHIPTIQWKDVGGLSHVRSEIMDAIELPLQHPKLFENSSGRSGILLYGPPGTGKTLIAKAVATECGLPFLSVKGPELLGSYVGESEANVRAIFAQARKAAAMGRTTGASVLFFDELDSLAPRRGGVGDGGGVMERVVATMLTELDNEDASCMVFVIGATNRPDLLDPSLIRPGRLDRLVYLGMATKNKDRAQILAALIRKFRLSPQDPMEVAMEVEGLLPANLTGADFSAIASGALRKSLERVCSEAEDELATRQQTDAHLTLDDVLDEWDEERLVPVVTCDDLVEASKDVVPSVSAEQLADYERLRVQFSSSE